MQSIDPRSVLHRLPRDVRASLSLLTCLPADRNNTLSYDTGSGWSWPLVGAAVGAVGAAVAALCTMAGMPEVLAALLALASMIALTGALHEDGLADSADGLIGGTSRQQRLDIMQDSRIGTFGAVALLVVLSGRLACMFELLAAGELAGPLIAAAAMSRAAMFGAMHLADPARPGGMAAALGKPTPASLAAGLAIGSVVAFLAAGLAALAAAAAALAVGMVFIGLARRRIGGVTGDILGCAQQLTELAFLVTMASLV